MDDSTRIPFTDEAYTTEPFGASADLNAPENYIRYDIFGGTREFIGGDAADVSVDGLAILRGLLFALAILQFFTAVLSIVLLAAIFYYRYKTLEIRRAEALWLYGPASAREDIKENENWQQVLEYVNSSEPSHWRLAILEADLMLDSIVSQMRYRGQTLTERLQVIEESDFTTIEQAREAHSFKEYMVGNGLDFVITQAEAKRVIELYRQVFVEFRLIYDLKPLGK